MLKIMAIEEVKNLCSDCESHQLKRFSIAEKIQV